MLFFVHRGVTDAVAYSLRLFRAVKIRSDNFSFFISTVVDIDLWFREYASGISLTGSILPSLVYDVWSLLLVLAGHFHSLGYDDITRICPMKMTDVPSTFPPD